MHRHDPEQGVSEAKSLLLALLTTLFCFPLAYACRQSMLRGKAKARRLPLTGFLLVGVAGFEPATLWSQTRYATRLRYTPKRKCKSIKFFVISIP